MKTKFTKKGRRILSAALCLLMMVTALPMSAFAWTSEEGKSCTSSFGDYYVGSDGEYYRSKAPYSFIVYDSNGDISVRTANGGTAKREYLMTDNIPLRVTLATPVGRTATLSAVALSMATVFPLIKNGQKKTRGYSSGSFALHRPFTVASITDSSLSSNLSSCASKRLRTELFLTSLAGNIYSSTETSNI